MLYVRLDATAPAEWRPLERLSRLCAHRLEVPALDPGDFMYLGCLVAAGLPPVHMYKHVDTRRYLYVDDLGHASDIRWCETGGLDTIAVCVRYTNLIDALDALNLPASPAISR